MKREITVIYITSIVAILSISLSIWLRCDYRSDLMPLTDSDREWLHIDSLMIYASDRGNTDSTIITDPTVITNRWTIGEHGMTYIYEPIQMKKVDGKYEACVIQKIQNAGKFRIIRMHIHRSHNDFLDVFLSVQCIDNICFKEDFDIRFINRTLKPSNVVLQGRTFNDCLVVDTWDSDTLFYYDRNKNYHKTNNMDNVIWSKDYGLIYYKLEDGEEFIRKFD